MKRALILLGALLSAPVVAAPVASKSDAEAVRRLQSTGSCVAQARPQLAHDLVLADHRSKDYRRLIRQVQDAHGDCPGEGLGFAAGGLLYAGAIAEALLRERGLVERLPEATAHDPSRPNIEARSVADFFAFCVVRQDAPRVAALFGAQVTSAAELDAILALQPAMGRCAPKDSKSEFTREALRALFALNAYRLYAHNAGTAEGSAR